MKTKNIIYPMVLVLVLLIPLMRYYSSTPWINACVLDYVDELGDGNFKWYMYDINWVKHIESANSKMIESLKNYKIWEANWCIMSWDNLFSDLNNTFYCTITYMIRKAPINYRLKEPLEILKKRIENIKN